MKKAIRFTNKFLTPRGYSVVKNIELVDYVLHNYDSYEEYKNTQVHYNIEKLDRVWADAQTLDSVAKIVKGNTQNDSVLGLCHGTRNGFEQNYLNKNYSNFQVIGTDISKTAENFENSVVWDFHDENPEWHEKFDFVYSNSLDQAWKPKAALTQWLNQIKKDGCVIIEHTASHGPAESGKMDPFGVRPTVMPYVIAEWFGHQVSISFEKKKKSNNNIDVWLFILKKNVKTVS